ncbi:MAG: aminoacyl-tRNA deacylase [Mycobacterium sp.]
MPQEVLQYHHDPRNESFGEEAAEALARDEGVDAEQVLKTLAVALPKGLGAALAATSDSASRCCPHASGGPQVPAKLSLKATAAALGVPKATMAERAAAERSSGYVIGGISPFGQRRPLPTVVDESALRWDRVLCSAGKRGWEVALHPRDLIAPTSATTAAISA